MPAAKQYVVIVAAGDVNNRITPAGARRIGIVIQNTGVNPCVYRWENAVQLDGGDIEMAAGGKDEYLIPETCPQEALNFSSTLGTTVAVVEILEGRQ
jgi:hypothetical protein